MTRPTAARDNSKPENRPPDFSMSGIDPVHQLSNLDSMYGQSSEEQSKDGIDDNVNPDAATDDNTSYDDPTDDSLDYSDGDDLEFDFDDRTPEQAAKEALRRSRRTQEAVAEMSSKIDTLLNTMQQSGAPGAAPAVNLDDMSFSPEERELINEAMKTDPSTALEIIQRNLLKNARTYAETTIASTLAMDNARREAEREIARLYPVMKNSTHPFRRAVVSRLQDLRRDYSKRGIDPNSVPELIKLAAHEVATTQPRLLGNDDPRTNMREESRRRNADRVTRRSRTRSTYKKDDLPDLSPEDEARGRRMGLNMSDPKVRMSLRARRRYYEGRRR